MKDMLVAASTDRLREELQKEMKSEPAPEFSLEDLEGNQVSLSSLKGKTLVLDFWTTWCRPCIGAFPGMKRAAEKYADDPEVEFLFVNTWQNEEDKKIMPWTTSPKTTILSTCCSTSKTRSLRPSR